MQNVSRLTAAPCLPRLLIVLSLAAALVVIPAASPEEVSARRTSERAATSACNFLGGELISVPMDSEYPDVARTFYCDLPWALGATAFQCTSTDGVFGNIVDCGY
jgi:hypothetical protein